MLWDFNQEAFDFYAALGYQPLSHVLAKKLRRRAPR